MTLLQALFLGILQSLTEFLPISSSGHLILLPKLLGIQEQPLVFDTILHVSTVLAIMVYFREYLWNLILQFLKDLYKNKFDLPRYSLEGRFVTLMGVSSIPAVIFGLFFDDMLENYFRDPLYVALFLVIGSIILLMAEKLPKLLSKPEKPLYGLTYIQGFIIGIFQSLALFPGISRSGATISGGQLLGLTREDAARFSFLISIPIMFAAAVFQCITSLDTLRTISSVVLLGGFIASFVSGLVVIKCLLNFVKKHSFTVFIVYRLLLAIVVLFFLN